MCKKISAEIINLLPKLSAHAMILLSFRFFTRTKTIIYQGDGLLINLISKVLDKKFMLHSDRKSVV